MMKVLKWIVVGLFGLYIVSQVMEPCEEHLRGETGNYPMPTMQEECVSHLYDVLMSPEGRAMTGAQLAVLRDTGRLRNVFRINLPVSDADQLPRMGVYRGGGEGAAPLEFLPLGADDPLDTIHAVCQAVTTFGYEGGTADTLLVQNRGGGILTLYRYVHRGGPNGGKHRCYDKHPDGYPEYSTVVLSVFQGADSLVVNSGYEASKRVYRYANNRRVNYEH